MTRSSLTTALILASAGGGCAVLHAPGYETLAAHGDELRIEATPFEMFGRTPPSFDLPDGRQIHIETRRAQVSRSAGTTTVDLAFSLTLGDERLVCASNPTGTDVPETRFGCWSPDGTRVRFWLAPNAGCRGLGDAELLTSSRCWSGQLDLARRRFDVAYSSLEATGSPVGRITWVDAATGTPVQAARSIHDMQLGVYRAAPQATPQGDLLTLHAVALHTWYHTVYDD